MDLNEFDLALVSYTDEEMDYAATLAAEYDLDESICPSEVL